MLTIPVVRRTIDHLRRPFIQRLITLIIVTLLAMSLISTICVPALPPSGREVASYTYNQSAHLGAARIMNLMSKMHGQRVNARAAEKPNRERRLV